MNDFESQLREALLQNGSLDPEKKEHLGAKAREHFDASMRKAERATYAGLALMMLLFLAAWALLDASASVKNQIVCAVWMLVFVEGMVAAKLWYWAVHGTIALLKEVCLLRLGASTAPPATELLLRRGRHLSQRERAFWRWGSLAVIIAAMVLLSLLTFGWTVPLDTFFRREIISVNTDGSGLTTAHVNYLYHGDEPVATLEYFAGGGARLDPSSPKWYDAKGRRLPVDVATRKDEVCWTVQLIEPFVPGNWVYYRQESESHARASYEGGLWVVRGEYTYGFRRNRFTEEVTLPPGAIIESVSPGSTEKLERNGRPVVVVQAGTGGRETFRFEIKYRLPRASEAAHGDGTRRRTSNDGAAE